MARIKINCEGVDSANLILNSIKNSIVAIKNDSYSIYLPPIFGSQYNINSRVWNAINRLSAIEYKLNSIKAVTSSASTKYKMADAQINIKQFAKNISFKTLKNGKTSKNSKLFDDFKSHGGLGINFEEIPEKIGYFDDFGVGPDKIARDVLGVTAAAIANATEKENEKKGVIRNTLDGIQNIKDKKNEVVDNIVDKTSISGEAKASVSFSKGEASVEGKYGSASAEYDFLNATAFASGAAGIFQKDKNGNLVFNPNVSAKIGASVTALTAKAEGKLGNDLIGVHGDVDATVGRAAADAELKAGIFDKDGSFNPSAKVSASLEAIAVEANAKAGVTVLGTDIDAKAGVNVGIGAHADIGFSDGKLKFDVGASLGVGVSVDLEVDVSKTVNAVKNVAIDVADKVIDAAPGVVKNVANVANTAVNAVSNVADKATNVVNNTVNTVSNAASCVWNTVAFWK